MRPILRGAVLLILSLLVLPACGGAGETPSPLAANPAGGASGATSSPAPAGPTSPPAAPATAVPAPTGWQDLAPANSGFHAALPAAPTSGQLNLPTPQGQVTLQTFTVVQNAITYTVGFGDYSADVVQKTPLARILDGARDGLQKATGLPMKHEDSVRRPGAQSDDGRLVEMAGPGGVYASARCFLIGQRLYLLQAAASSADQAHLESAKLFATFSVSGP